MATKLAPLPSPLAFWDRFQHLAAVRVRECNIVAGEELWITTGAADPIPTVVVVSTTCSQNRVECSFDPDRRILACKPGPALRIEPHQFEWIAETGDILRRESREFTLDEAVNLLLDELVCTENAGIASPSEIKAE